MKIIKCFLISQILLNLTILNPSFSKNLNIPNKIQFELSNSEYNKYLRRAMRAYTDGEIYGEKNIKKKYKKWVNANIIHDKKTLKTKIRILGDWKDHLRPPQTSLKVKILDNSLNGVTRFNLFLPETRKGENEVFWTLMLKYLSFPSLYTKMVEVNLNGNIYKAIFQEDATKEFLERNHLTETVILKLNDFNFYLNEKEKKVYDNFFSSSFVIDNNNFLKNDIANFIASEAIASRANINFEKQVLNENFFQKIHKKYAYHALAEINRKYIYIPYKKLFVPLYYDGNVQFLPGKTNCNFKIDNKILNNFKKDFKILSGKKLSKMQECVLRDTLNSSSGNIQNLSNFYPNQKTDNKKNTKYLTIKNMIIDYFDKNKINKIKNIKKISEKIIIYSFIFNDKFYKCYLSINENKIKTCEQIDSKSYSKIISESGRHKITDNFKSFPINLGSFNKEMPIIWLTDDDNEFKMNKKGTYYFIQKNKKDIDLNFIFQNSEAKLFIQGNFENVNFNFIKDFENQNKKFDNVRYDKNLLTGCVNFFDTNFDEVSLISANMICEDSINIKNSEGILNKIDISNSFFDALDLDFSKITIKNLKVDNAKNDCADFSFGEYEIIQANLKNCGDKGFSVGESSKFILNNGNIFFSNIGIASKDDALTNINKVYMDNINICLAAYNKKKEFKGSKINVKDFNCKQYATLKQSDNLSEINISKEN
tara:strand:- start:2436 stop:4559 length:2124 start_codon:yes stop_codon:yes gene_type:complete